MPGGHSDRFADSIPTAIDDGSPDLHLGKPVEPLLAQRCDECGEEGSSQAGVEDGLDVDDGRIRTSPFRESSLRASGNFAERYTGNDCEESVAHLCVIGLELALDVDDESGCNRREQTGLSPVQFEIRSNSGRTWG